MKIAWSIKIPKGAKLKVKNGQSVLEGDVIYEYHLDSIERLPLMGWQNLGLDDRKTVLSQILKRTLTKGEFLWKGSWFNNISLNSPGEGKCKGVDEFGNIELETEKEEIYLAPISAKNIRVEDEKIIFELRGTEYEAKGINELKGWGDFEARIVDDLDLIGKSQIRQVVMIKDHLEVAIKAEAVGVSGLILIDVPKENEFEDSDIPVVSMEKSEAEKLIKIVDGKKAKVWINASAAKVLLVLE